MKKIIVFIFVLVLACEPASMITASWKSPDLKTKKYNSVMVAALTTHAVAKAAVEKELEAELEKHNVTAASSIDLLPMEFSNVDSDRVVIMNKVKEKDIQAILTISLLKKETETHYVPGEYAYDPYRFGYYRDFWGYYSRWHSYGYVPGYYEENTVYYIESNLYDSETEKLVWSAQSKTYDLLDTPGFSKEYAISIVRQLKKEGLIPEGKKKEDDEL
jgi:hypothetical protein